MNRRKQILKVDIVVQSLLITILVVCIVVAFGYDGQRDYEGSFYLALISFLLLLAWQFFSGIYIGVELRMKHRSLFQVAYFCLGLIGLLFTVMGMPMGLIIVFSFTPVFMMIYFLVACFDLRKALIRDKVKDLGDDKILDSGDFFD